MPPAHPFDLADLVRNHGTGLAGAVRGVLGSRADVAEVLQEVFLKGWKALEKGTQPADPVAWVFVLTLNHARDLRRKQQRRGPGIDLDDVDPMQISKSSTRPDAAVVQAETLGAARAAIARLKEEQREVFLLRSSAGLTFDAIASALGIPVGTAKTRMRAALAALRLSLAAHTPEHLAEGGSQ